MTPAWAAFRADPTNAQRMLDHLADGGSLQSFADAEGVRTSSLLFWIEGDKALSEQYARACLVRADVMFEKMEEIAEESLAAKTPMESQGYKLKIDVAKWKLARMNSKKYGEKTQLTGDGGGPVKTENTTVTIDPGTLSDEQLRLLSGIPLPSGQ